MGRALTAYSDSAVTNLAAATTGLDDAHHLFANSSLDDVADTGGLREYAADESGDRASCCQCERLPPKPAH